MPGLSILGYDYAVKIFQRSGVSEATRSTEIRLTVGTPSVSLIETRSGGTRALLLRDMISAIRLKRQLGNLYHFDVEVKPTNIRVGKELLDSGTFSIGNIIAVRFGYTSDPDLRSPWIIGFLTKPDVQVDATQITFTLKGVASGFAMSRKMASRSFPKLSRLEIIERVARENGLIVIDELSVEDSRFLNEKVDNVVQRMETDMEFIKRLVRTGGNVIAVEFLNNKIRLISVSEKMRPQNARFRLGYFTHPILPERFGSELKARGGKLTFPILSYDSPTSLSFLSPESVAADIESGLDFAGGGDVADIILRPGRAPEIRKLGDSSPAAEELIQAVNQFIGQNADFVRDPKLLSFQPDKANATADSPEAVVRSRSLAASFGNFQATVTTYGHPKVEPGDLVEIVGMGKKLSGLFFVMGVEFMLDSRGFRMTLSLTRNAFTSEGKGVAGEIVRPLPDLDTPVNRKESINRIVKTALQLDE